MAYAKLQQMLGAALVQAAEESGMLLGQTLTVTEPEVVSTGRQGYFAQMEDPAFVAQIISSGDYASTFYMVFYLRDAIVMSGILLGIPPARISEKCRLMILEADDEDAFKEITNGIIGSFNTVFQKNLPNKVHLKLIPPKKFIPEVNEINDYEPFPDGDYRLFYSQMELPGQMMNRIDILLPHDFCALLDPEGEQADAAPEEEEDAAGEDVSDVADAPATAAAPAAAAPKGAPVVVILDDVEAERTKVKSMLEEAGINCVAGPLNADLRQILNENLVKTVLIGSDQADDRELSLCIKIASLAQDAPPAIIMCANQWTRTGVLKAVKFGANDIILKPYIARDLMAKIGRYVKAA